MKKAGWKRDARKRGYYSREDVIRQPNRPGVKADLGFGSRPPVGLEAIDRRIAKSKKDRS